MLPILVLTQNLQRLGKWDDGIHRLDRACIEVQVGKADAFGEAAGAAAVKDLVQKLLR